MKKGLLNSFMRFLVLLLSLVPGLSVWAAEQDNEVNYLHDAQRIFETMKEEMESAPKTGDVSINFLLGMIPHHTAAIEMSKNILEYGSDVKVQELAKAIVKEQKAGIIKMKQLLEGIQVEPQIDKEKEASYLKAYVQIYKQMVAEMEAAEPSGNSDKDFLEEMIPHHEGAIKMATNILKYTNIDELKKQAQHTIVCQKRQLTQMKKLLKSM